MCVKYLPLGLALLPAVAPAAETIAYGYDARGRLVRVERSGSINNGVVSTYSFDKADNRLAKTTSGAASGGGGDSTGAGPATIASASFENPDLGSGFAYNPAAPGVTFGPSTGVAGNGSAWGFASAPDGDQVAFAQGFGAKMSQEVTGLVAGSSYTLSFSSAQRPGYGGIPIVVRFNGAVLGTFMPPSTDFTRFTTPAFQASATTGTIEFAGDGVTPGDVSSAIDAVAIAVAEAVAAPGPGNVASASFENPDLGSGFAYNPAAPGVTFGPSTGIAGNGSAWGFASAPDGDQVAFAQGFGAKMSQEVTGLVAGSRYKLSFSSAQRPGYGGIPIVVRFNGTVLGTFMPPSTDFTRFTTPAFQASATTGTIEFAGDGVTPGDVSSAIDAVAVTPAQP